MLMTSLFFFKIQVYTVKFVNDKSDLHLDENSCIKPLRQLISYENGFFTVFNACVLSDE